MITAPTVRLFMYSVRSPEVDDVMEFFEDTTDGDASAVFAGRACYQSFDRQYEPTAADKDYIEKILHGAKHASIAEHGHVAFYVTGMSRSCANELVRHRQLGYSQLSQRYVPSDDLDWVCPIKYLTNESRQYVVGDEFRHAVRAYEDLVEEELVDLKAEGITGTEARKIARQSARAVLPNCTETRLVVSGNYRAWMEASLKRIGPGAEPEIVRLFGEYFLPRLHEQAPSLFEPLMELR